MAQTKSTRVVFREETICNYTDTKFLQSNPQCSIREVSSVVEDFDPTNIKQEHYDFVLRRNEAVPQPLVPHSSTNPTRDRKDIIPPVAIDTFVNRFTFDNAELDPMLRAGRQNIPNMTDAIQNVINRQDYANRLSQLSKEGIGLEELPDRSASIPTETDALLGDFDSGAMVDTFANGDFVTGSNLTTDQQETLRLTAEIDESVMKARAKSKARTKILLEEAVPTSKTKGTELTDFKLTNTAREQGYGQQTQRGSEMSSHRQGSSNEPIAPPDVLNINMLSHGLPLEVLQVSFEMPPELKNLKIPNMPDPTKVVDSASYRLEKTIYETKLAELYKAIDGSYKIDNYTKEILKKQIAIHEEEVNLRAKIVNNPAIIEDTTLIFGGEFNQPNLINLETTKFETQLNKLFVEQQIYNELRGIPSADRAVTLLEMQSNSSNFTEFFTSRSGTTISQSDFVESLGKVSEVMTNFEKANPPVTQLQPQQQTSIVKSVKYSETFKNINASALGETIGHTLTGMAVAMLIAHYAGESDIFRNIENIYARGAAIGASVGVAGTIPTIASRFFFIATRNAITMAGETVLAATSRALIKGAISSIAEIAAGGILGAALVPLDMLFQDFLLKNGFNHAGAGALSGATMAGIGTVASLAIGATVESISAGALTLGTALAPETLGLSVVVALGTMAFAGIVGAVFGGYTDDRARRDRDTHNINRKWVLDNLARNNYDVIGTIQEFERQKYGRLATNQESDEDFGDYQTDARPFIEMLQTKFEGRTFEQPIVVKAENSAGSFEAEVSPVLLTEKERTIQRLMAQDLLPTMRDIAIKDGHPEIGEALEKLPDFKYLTSDEWEWLDKNTDKTWYRDSLLSGQIHYEELKYSQMKSADAQLQLYRIWNDTHSLEYDPQLVIWAAKDSSFAARFTQSRMFDAQRIIMENFQTNGKLFDENEANIIAMANTPDPTLPYVDPDGEYGFKTLFTTYTTNMETTADNMNITIPQLLSLQNLPEDRRERAFLTYQYNTLRENTLTRDEVENIRRYDEENTAIRARGFYSRDDEILAITPVEEYGTWNPTDAEIWRSQEAGMTLRQYLDYMHLLSMGDNGDINNLPEYSPEEVTRQRQEDRIAFQRQLDLTHNNEAIIYDEATQRFIINPDSANDFVIRQEGMNRRNLYYSPQAYQSDENFHDLIHGMNETNQKSYDAYNLDLAGNLLQYNQQYQREVFEYNEYQHITGQQNFLYFDANAEYHSRRLAYDPMSSNPDDYITKPPVVKPSTNKHSSDNPDPYEIKNGKPPRLTKDDNIEGLLNDENRALAYEQIDRQALETNHELSHDERQYIFRQAFNKQYYESSYERDYWTQRSQMSERLKFANQGLDPETATDADRADNLHMELSQYYEYIGTLPKNNAFFNPEEYEEEEVNVEVEVAEDNIEEDEYYETPEPTE
jgi:hypothetical protein